MNDKYVATIGIECHVQLKTTSKLFSGADNNAVDVEPNSVVTPICFGLPGVLPVLNQEAVNLAIYAGVALNAEIPMISKFDRKHYFYPDLPKGYQITQFDLPVVGKGYVDITVEGKEKRIGVTRAHLEEDAGKSTHPAGKDYSLVDLNRAGTPLLEIVSEPDINSASEAKAYAQELYYLMKYSGVSNVDLFQGNMRFDINVSVALLGAKELGTRSETKNLNSFRSIEKATTYEIKRQIELLEKGEKVVQETRGWDDAKQKTFSQRSKEEAHDYRYFPEPDVPPVTVSQAEIDTAKKVLNNLPKDIRKSLSEIGVPRPNIEILLEMDGTDGINFIQLIKDVAKTNSEAGLFTANWLINVEPEIRVSLQKAQKDFNFIPSKNQMIDIYNMQKNNQLSSSAVKTILQKIKSDKLSTAITELAQELDLIQESDNSKLEEIVRKVLGENPQAIKDINAGEQKAIGFLIGQVMKQSGGKANPQSVREIIIRISNA